MIRIWFGRCVWHLRPNFANRGAAAERCKTVAVGNARVILSASEGLTDRDCGPVQNCVIYAFGKTLAGPSRSGVNAVRDARATLFAEMAQFLVPLRCAISQGSE